MDSGIKKAGMINRDIYGRPKWIEGIPGYTRYTRTVTVCIDTSVLRRKGVSSEVAISGQPGNGLAYLHTDHLGTVVKATDEAQNVVWDAVRRPFGGRSVEVAQVEMPLGFAGQYYDKESGNFYNYYRDYDPTTGRYLQSDPIGLDGGLNTYLYVNGAPVLQVDPMGLWGIDWGRVAGIGVSATVGRGGLGFSGGGGIEMRQCCMNNKVYNEIYSVLRVGVGAGRSVSASASGKGNFPVPTVASSPGLPSCMILDYEVGKPFGSWNVAAGPFTSRFTTSGSVNVGYSPGGEGASISVNIIDRRWLIAREKTSLTCGCEK